MIFWAILLRHFAFNDFITPWSIACVVDVVLGGKKNNLIDFKLSIWEFDNYLLLVPHFFLLMKTIALILASTLQTVLHPSSFFFDVNIVKVKTLRF